MAKKEKSEKVKKEKVVKAVKVKKEPKPKKEKKVKEVVEPVIEGEPKEVQASITKEVIQHIVDIDKPYKIVFGGFNGEAPDKNGEPSRFYFRDDVLFFETHQLASEFIESPPRITEHLQRSKLFQYMVSRYNSSLPFITLIKAIIKFEKDGKSIYFYEQEKEIEVGGFFSKESDEHKGVDDKIVMGTAMPPEEEKPSNLKVVK